MEVYERGTVVTVLLNGVVAGARRAMVREVVVGVQVGWRVVDVDDERVENDVLVGREDVVLVRGGVDVELETLDDTTAELRLELVVAYQAISTPLPFFKVLLRTHRRTNKHKLDLSLSLRCYIPRIRPFDRDALTRVERR